MIPGVYLHAEALHELLADELARPAPAYWRPAAGIALAVLGGVFGLSLGPVAALAAALVVASGVVAAALLLLATGIWLPLAVPVTGFAAATGLTYVGRFTLERRRRRLVQRAFGHYLAPAVVAQIASRETLPRLGGETVSISVMFADLSGFTALSGRIPPSRLVEVTNRQFGLITRAIERSNGYVDKFIGDAVMAVWGAPIPDPDHAVHAISAALEIAAGIDQARRAAEEAGEPAFRIKIGINSGPAVAGNIGWGERLNYTVVGETVNLAARLEGLPGQYDCAILAGPETASAAGKTYLLYEVDAVTVKGKADPIEVFEPLGPRCDADDALHRYARSYREALSAWRAGDVERAAWIWGRLAYPLPYGLAGGPPKVMAERARASAVSGVRQDH